MLLLVELVLWRSGLPDMLAGLPVGLDESSLETVSNGLRFFRTEEEAFSFSTSLMRVSGETRGRKMPRLLRLPGLSDMTGGGLEEEERNQSLIGHGFREISNRSDEDRISIKMEKIGRNV